MSDSKKLFIQVPDEIIRNTYCKMDSKTFASYVLLKFLYFRKFNKDTFPIDHNIFKHKLFISDNRTLKNIFKSLHKHGFIYEYIDKLPTKGELNITFDPIPFDSEKFTQLPASIFSRIESIGVIGLRLMFYYESYINRTESISKQYAFPAIETISHDLKLNKETVQKYNDILVQNKLLKIVKHELEYQGYNELDQILYTKFNNHYYVKIEKL